MLRAINLILEKPEITIEFFLIIIIEVVLLNKEYHLKYASSRL